MNEKRLYDWVSSKYHGVVASAAGGLSRNSSEGDPSTLTSTMVPAKNLLLLGSWQWPHEDMPRKVSLCNQFKWTLNPEGHQKTLAFLFLSAEWRDAMAHLPLLGKSEILQKKGQVRHPTDLYRLLYPYLWYPCWPGLCHVLFTHFPCSPPLSSKGLMDTH